MPLSLPSAASALLLAAGRGERMRPLTDTCPKPLLTVRDKPLMQWALEAMWRGGVHDVVVNTAWLGEQISEHFGAALRPLDEPNAARAPLHLHYSHEGRDFGGALETAGAIVRALPWLQEVFWVAAGDVFAPDFVFDPQEKDRFARSEALAHLWLVPNPVHHPQGDFGLSPQGLALNAPLPLKADAPLHRYTFSTIALYKRAFFQAHWCAIPMGNPQGVKAPLASMLRAAMDEGKVSASLYHGAWTDVGTPERLAQLNA